MTAASVTQHWSAPLAISGNGGSTGYAVCPSTIETDRFVIATTANLALVDNYIAGLLLDNVGAGGSARVMIVGPLDRSILGPGSAGQLYLSSTGLLTRTPPSAGARVIGWVNSYGDGLFDATGDGLLAGYMLTAAPNSAVGLNGGVGSAASTTPATETLFRFGSGSTISDWINWGGNGAQLSVGAVAFGADGIVAPSGALRFATPVNRRTTLMSSWATGSGVTLGREFQSIINVSSAANGASQSLEVGREFFEQTLIYGGRYLINVINPALWGDGGSWLWEVEGYGYQISLETHVAGAYVTWIYGTAWDQVIEQFVPRAGVGRAFTRRAGLGTGGGSTGGLNRLEGGEGAAIGGAVELAGGAGATRYGEVKLLGPMTLGFFTQAMADAPQTVNAANSCNNVIVVTGVNSAVRALTLSRSVTSGAAVIVRNNCTVFGITVQFLTGNATATIPPGTSAFVCSDNANAIILMSGT